MRQSLLVVASAALGLATAFIQAPPQKFVPAPVSPSDLTLRVESVGRIPTHTNPTSPVAAGAQLLLIDQAGFVYVWDGSKAAEILGPRDTPAGLRLIGHERILNAAADAPGKTVYVAFISATVPSGVPKRVSPRDGSDGWYVLYAFSFDGTRLTAPRPITAMQVRTEGHTGGGLAVLPDGSVLFAAGDNGDSFEDGRDYSQDPAVHLSKIVRVDPATGAVSVVASGVRCAQRLIVNGAGSEARVSFVDPGGWVSEELNNLRIADLLLGDRRANFGWGRAPDGRSREGTFYIDRVGNSTMSISSREDGYLDPVSEFGREGAAAVAVSGPVVSATSFSRIAMLFGDLVSGSVYAITRPPTDLRQAAYRVALVDANDRPITLKGLANGQRPDPRFFNLPDGSAGVLLERTGEFFRLTEKR